jgi:hypothetical protein
MSISIDPPYRAQLYTHQSKEYTAILVVYNPHIIKPKLVSFVHFEEESQVVYAASISSYESFETCSV